MPLDPDTSLDIALSAAMSRARFTRDPIPVLEELRALAGPRTDVLARTAGHWVGYYRSDDTAVLADALLTIDGASDWVGAGEARRSAPYPGDCSRERRKSAPAPTRR